MSPSEIAGLDTTGAADATATETSLAAGATSAVDAADAAGSIGEASADRLSLAVLSRDPEIHFQENTVTGALGAVTQSPVTGATLPLSTGIRSGELARDLLAGLPELLLATKPLVREVTGQGDTPGHTDVIDPRTGEVVQRLAQDDSFGLDQAVRDFTRRSLVDKAV